MSPIRDRADRLTGFSIIARDVTAKRRSEQYLARAKAAAEEASRAKSTFLANMSHEIRTPLHNIIGLAELLRRDETQPAQQQRLRSLLETADHMMSVVNGILELPRIEAHRVAIDHRDFDLTEVVEGAVAVVRQPALAKGLDVVVRIAPEAAWHRAGRRRPAHPAGADQPREQCRQVHRTRLDRDCGGLRVEDARHGDRALRSVSHLSHGSEILEQLSQREGLMVVGAEYSLETGVVDFFYGVDND